MKQRERNTFLDVATVAAVLAAIGGYFRFVRQSEHPVFGWLMVVAALLLAGAVLSRPFRNAFSRYWMKLGHALGNVNSCILLSVIFVLVLLPLAGLRKIFSRGTTDLRSKLPQSMWHPREHTYAAGDLEKMW